MKDIVKVLSEYVKIESIKDTPAQNAPFGEKIRQALNYILSLGEEFGLTVRDIDGYAGEIEYESGKEVIGVLAHTDVVPLGGGWVHGQGEIDNGNLYGRGAVDDKGPAVAVLYALKEIKDEGIKLNKTLRLIIGCDEESGCECMDYYIKKGRMPKTGFSPDAEFPLISCEKTILQLKVIIPMDNYWAENISVLKGGLRPNMVPAQATLKIKTSALGEDYETALDKLEAKADKTEGQYTAISFKGKSAHGSTPQEGVNAVWKIFEFLKGINGKGIIKTLNHYLMNDDACKKMGLYMEDEKSGNQTLNIGTAEYNGKDNKLELSLDFRCPIPQKTDTVINRLKDLLPVGTEIQITHQMPYLYADPNSFLVKTLLKSYEKITGEKGQGIITGGGTYARLLPQGVAFGPSFPGEEPNIHNAEEVISIDNLKLLVKIYKDAMINLAK